MNHLPTKKLSPFLPRGKRSRMACKEAGHLLLCPGVPQKLTALSEVSLILHGTKWRRSLSTMAWLDLSRGRKLAVQTTSGHSLHSAPSARFRELPRLGLWLALCFVSLMPLPAIAVPPDSAPVITVSPDDMQFDFGGEFDAVVIQPGLNVGCPSGRVLASNDYQITFRDDTSGVPQQGQPLRLGMNRDGDSVVTGRDFDGGNRIVSRFDPVANPDDHLFGSSDHDLVSLPDGTILLLVVGWLKSPISPKPAWFDNTFREYTDNTDPTGMRKLKFGPGARSMISVWRSTDCGASFHWVSDLDSADPAFENGNCGLPQFRRDASGQPIQMPPWDLGGTDGPKAAVRVDHRNGDVWLVHQCVGYFPKENTPTFELDPNNPLREALVFRSRNQGTSWDIAARVSPTLPFTNQVWRGDFALRGNTAALTDGRSSGPWVAPFSSEQGIVAMFPEQRIDPFPDQKVGYSDDFIADLMTCTTPICMLRMQGFRTNFLTHTVMSPFGSGSLVLVAYPSVIPRGAGQGLANGYVVYVLDVSNPTDSARQLSPVLPESGDEHESFIAFLTMVPDGRGSALLYWYDVDARSGQTRIRGRHISPRTESGDFAISRSGGQERSWAYTDNTWYGDYHESEGFSFLLPPVFPSRTATLRHIYFPAWADANQRSHATQVIVDESVRFRRLPLVFGTAADEPSETSEGESSTSVNEADR